MKSKIRQLLNQKLKAMVLPKQAAGRELVTKIPLVTPDKTIGEIKALLAEFAQKNDTIGYIYVVNHKNKLVGVISIKELARLASDKHIKEVMTKNLIVSHPQVDKTRVAHLAIKHNLKAIPIIDKHHRLMGILSSDKILSILYNEYKKSFYRFSSIVPSGDSFGTILDSGILKNFLSRLPWIIIGLIGGIFAAQVIEFFDATLSRNIILAVFIPLVVYINNAVGAQTQTFFVRDIAFNPNLTIILYFLKQLVSSSLVGLACSLVIWLIIGLFWGTWFIGFVVGLAALTSISISTLIAVFIPYLLFRLNQDPASGGGPFGAILQDLISIYVYFQIATLLL